MSQHLDIWGSRETNDVTNLCGDTFWLVALLSVLRLQPSEQSVRSLNLQAMVTWQRKQAVRSLGHSSLQTGVYFALACSAVWYFDLLLGAKNVWWISYQRNPGYCNSLQFHQHHIYMQASEVTINDCKIVLSVLILI